MAVSFGLEIDKSRRLPRRTKPSGGLRPIDRHERPANTVELVDEPLEDLLASKNVFFASRSLVGLEKACKEACDLSRISSMEWRRPKSSFETSLRGLIELIGRDLHLARLLRSGP